MHSRPFLTYVRAHRRVHLRLARTGGHPHAGATCGKISRREASMFTLRLLVQRDRTRRAHRVRSTTCISSSTLYLCESPAAGDRVFDASRGNARNSRVISADPLIWSIFIFISYLYLYVFCIFHVAVIFYMTFGEIKIGHIGGVTDLTWKIFVEHYGRDYFQSWLGVNLTWCKFTLTSRCNWYLLSKSDIRWTEIVLVKR